MLGDMVFRSELTVDDLMPPPSPRSPQDQESAFETSTTIPWRPLPPPTCFSDPIAVVSGPQAARIKEPVVPVIHHELPANEPTELKIGLTNQGRSELASSPFPSMDRMRCRSHRPASSMAMGYSPSSLLPPTLSMSDTTAPLDTVHCPVSLVAHSKIMRRESAASARMRSQKSFMELLGRI